MYHFKKLCRLCTNSNNVSSVLSNSDSDNIILLDKLNTIAPGQIEPDNKLPNGVCMTCIAQLNEAYKFIKQCGESQENLKQHLQRLESEQIADRIKVEQDNTFEFVRVEVDLKIGANKIKLEDDHLAFNENEQSEINSCKFEQTDDCNKSETTEVNLHFVKVEDNFQQYECENSDTYESSFQTDINEESNNSSETNINKKLYKCKVCEKVFPFNSHYLRHIRSHTQERPYRCEICDKAFSKRENLKTHMRLHGNKKPFGCEICKKTFSQKEHLTRHIRTHTNERPYKCELCDKSFTQSGSLKWHIRTHTHERPYRCELCNKPFSDRSSLTRHVRRMKNEK